MILLTDTYESIVSPLPGQSWRLKNVGDDPVEVREVRSAGDDLTVNLPLRPGQTLRLSLATTDVSVRSVAPAGHVILEMIRWDVAVGTTPTELQADLVPGFRYYLINLGPAPVRVARSDTTPAADDGQIVPPRRSLADGMINAYSFANEPDFPDNGLWVQCDAGQATARVKTADPRI